MIEQDLHTHTTYSHGTGSILDNALAAQKKGIKLIGITDHGFNHPFYKMKRGKLALMKKECEQAESLTGVKVLLGVEANVIGVSGKTDVKQSDYAALDLYLAGMHRMVLSDKLSDYFKLFIPDLAVSFFKLKPSAGLIKRCTAAYINAIKSQPIDVLTHLNYYCFANALEVAKCCADYGTYLEINTKKTHLSDEEWQEIIDKTNVGFVIDSDAHSPERVGDAALAQDLFTRVSFPKNRIFNAYGNNLSLRFSEYKRSKL